MGNPILILPPEEARKIAAGEVIDRPAALVRELLDNAIDAGAQTIEVAIEEGGIRRTEVSDDGSGMTREDLEICWQTHATSKIRSLADLDTAETLGFRGEALAATAAVCRLEILTSTVGGEAWRLETGGGSQLRISPANRVKGSTVRATGLFDMVPARKRFLKREGSEALLCRQSLIEKALAFFTLNFRFIQDGKLKIFLPKAATRWERFSAAILNNRDGGFLHEISLQEPGFSVSLVIGGPELYRQDRRQQFIFANGRRIQDFSLLQALEYGVQGWFPNGTHPLGAVYVDIDPALADFNIHPAKREVRFKDSGAIHHAITTALRDFMRRRGIAGLRAPRDETRQREFGGFSPALPLAAGKRAYPPEGQGFRGGLFGERESASLAMKALLEDPPDFVLRPGRSWREGAGVSEAIPDYGLSAGEGGGGQKPRPPALRLAGRLFGLFILIEGGERLFIIDQHAAHERILFDRFLSKAIPVQELLVPIPFSTGSEEEDRFLSLRRGELKKLGVVIEGEARGEWRIEALPTDWRLGDADTVEEILKLRIAGEDMARRWAATLSCHGAIKDGDYLDDASALALAEAALALPEPRCPHGRPIWTEISREDLFRAVRRS
jgi:DNA mismatch repair protein MutL